MTKRLSEGDRRAVDLVLDRAAAGSGNGNGAAAAGGDGNGGSGYVSHAGAADEQRIGAVSRVLHLLDNLPAPEPSSDLVARTLSRVGEPMPALMEPAASGFTPRPSQQQPHA